MLLLADHKATITRAQERQKHVIHPFIQAILPMCIQILYVLVPLHVFQTVIITLFHIPALRGIFHLSARALESLKAMTS